MLEMHAFRTFEFLKFYSKFEIESFEIFRSSYLHFCFFINKKCLLFSCKPLHPYLQFSRYGLIRKTSRFIHQLKRALRSGHHTTLAFVVRNYSFFYIGRNSNIIIPCLLCLRDVEIPCHKCRNSLYQYKKPPQICDGLSVFYLIQPRKQSSRHETFQCV